jgi:hypothetical protein
MGAGASAQKTGKDKPDAAGALSAAADDAAAGKLDAAKKIFKASAWHCRKATRPVISATEPGVCRQLTRTRMES